MALHIIASQLTPNSWRKYQYSEMGAAMYHLSRRPATASADHARDAIDFPGSVAVAPTNSMYSGQQPILYIRQNPGAVIVYWQTAFANLTLESLLDLSSSTWTQIPGPYSVNGAYFEYSELNTSLQSAKFFRLRLTGAGAQQ
jgi:hypothetical protein